MPSKPEPSDMVTTDHIPATHSSDIKAQEPLPLKPKLQATDEKDKEGKSAAKKNKEGTQKSQKKVSKMFWVHM